MNATTAAAEPYDFRAFANRAHEATTPEELDALWLDMMGLEAVDFEDEAGGMSMDEQRAVIFDWLRDLCTGEGLDPAMFGIPAARPMAVPHMEGEADQEAARRVLALADTHLEAEVARAVAAERERLIAALRRDALSKWTAQSQAAFVWALGVLEGPNAELNGGRRPSV